VPAPQAGAFHQAWQDEPGNLLERRLTEIAISLMVEGEQQYRDRALSRHDWILERREALRQEARRKKEALERHRLERQRRREKQRVSGLLRQAHDFRKADDIRTLVASIRSASHNPLQAQMIEQWEAWATAEADRIDPIKNGQLVAHMRGAMAEADDPEETDTITEDDVNSFDWASLES
jgi:hypothetical protein